MLIFLYFGHTHLMKSYGLLVFLYFWHTWLTANSDNHFIDYIAIFWCIISTVYIKDAPILMSNAGAVNIFVYIISYCKLLITSMSYFVASCFLIYGSNKMSHTIFAKFYLMIFQIEQLIIPRKMALALTSPNWSLHPGFNSHLVLVPVWFTL